MAEFAERFAETRRQAVGTGDIRKFVALYRWLFDNLLFSSLDGPNRDESLKETRKEFLQNAYEMGKREIQEVQELEVLYEAKS